MNILHLGDCLKVLREMQDCSIDSIVTDPPYGLSFMGKRWDYDVPSVEIWAECLRVLKPGGHLLAFAGTRTQHRMACRIEDAGFEIRDMIAWVYGSGFPKSLDVSKAIDKAAGAEREVVGEKLTGKARTDDGWNGGQQMVPVTAPATPEARQWAGWGTALKPSLEPITVARKPFKGTVAANVLEHGTGALNVDGCRIDGLKGVPASPRRGANGGNAGGVYGKYEAPPTDTAGWNPSAGRWPANLIHDGSDEVVALFPNETARFFYCAKTSKRERGEDNNHPTVKPIALMAYLCRLITPSSGMILDPFMGSGSTGVAAISEGFSFTGIERDSDYFAIARNRINATPLSNTLQPPLSIAFD